MVAGTTITVMRVLRSDCIAGTFLSSADIIWWWTEKALGEKERSKV